MQSNINHDFLIWWQQTISLQRNYVRVSELYVASSQIYYFLVR